MGGLPERPVTFFRISPAERGNARCFAIRLSEADTRIDSKYHALREILSSPFPLAQLGALVRAEPSYGLSSRAVTRTSEYEPRFIRITDVGEDGIEPGHEFVTAYPLEPGYELNSGDVLFARSGATVGKTYFHEDTSEPAVFAGYCIRFQFDRSVVSPKFVYWWTKTEAYSRWVETIQRPSGQPNINKEEFKTCQIPLPTVQEQDRLVTVMDNARTDRKAKLVEADALLAGISDHFNESLGITTVDEEQKCFFAVKRRDVTDLSLGPFHYAPELRNYLKSLRNHPSTSKPLSAYVEINPSPNLSGMADDTLVGFIPMQAVSDGATGEYTVTDRPLREVKKGYTPFADGDVLWAKITPCMQNGKSCIAKGLPSGIGFGSTEYHVLRVRPERQSKISSEFVKEFVSNAELRRVAVYAFTGSAGQQRIPSTFLENLPFPALQMERQMEIVASIKVIREEAKRLRAEGESDWQDAKHWFERQLLGLTIP